MCCCGINFDWCTCWDACVGWAASFGSQSSSSAPSWMVILRCYGFFHLFNKWKRPNFSFNHFFCFFLSTHTHQKEKELRNKVINTYETLLCRLLIITGVILLVGSTKLVRFLASTRRTRSNAEKSYGPRRSTSSRVREPSPTSAVIQASTLNHLLSSSSKEKAWLDIS
jgi:hypothetical protein